MKRSPMLSMCLLVCINVSSCDSNGDRRGSGHDNEKETMAASKAHPEKQVRSNSSVATRTNEGDVATIWDGYVGEDRINALFAWFKNNPSSISVRIKDFALEMQDTAVAEALGECCGRTADDAWLAWIQDHFDGEYRSMARIGFIVGLAGASPEQLVSLLAALPQGEEKERMYGVAIIELCKSRPTLSEDLMSQWIQDSSGSKFNQQKPILLKAISEMLRQYNPADIEDILFGNLVLSLGERFGGEIAAIIAAKDPMLALRWSKGLNDGMQSSDGITSALRAQLLQQGDAAVMQTIDTCKFKYMPRANMIEAVLNMKVKDDPEAAAKWVEGLPTASDPMNSSYYYSLTSKWYEQDGMAASKWVARLAPGEGRDTAVIALVNAVVKSDLKSAITWGAEIQDSRLRQNLWNITIRSRYPPEQIKQVIQTMGSSLKFSEADLHALTNDK